MSDPKTVLHNKFEGIKKGNLSLKLKGYLCFTAYTKIITRPIINLNVKGKNNKVFRRPQRRISS